MRWTWLVVVLLFAPKSAHAFCRSTTNLDFLPTEEEPCDTAGKPLFWASRCVEVRVHSRASQQVDLGTARSLAGKSLAKWSEVTCDACGATGKPSLVVKEAGPTSCDFGFLRDKANTNVIVFRDTDWNHEPGMLALTTVSFRKDSGEILDADIEINSDPYQTKISSGAINPESFDLESILTHEAGHLIGLAHTPNADATMRPRYDKGDTTLRDLAPDDVCGACAAAAPSRAAACAPHSAASCDPASDPGAPPSNNAPPGDTGGGCSIGHTADSMPLWILLLVALSRLRSCNVRASSSRASKCSSDSR